jgi:hypothetical protein
MISACSIDEKYARQYMRNYKDIDKGGGSERVTAEDAEEQLVLGARSVL